MELAAELASRHPDKSVTIMHRGGQLIARTCASASAYADYTLRAMKVHIVYKKESNLVDKVLPNLFYGFTPSIPSARRPTVISFLFLPEFHCESPFDGSSHL